MGTVRLKLRGLSVCYLKENEAGQLVWKVFFPFDTGHQLTLKAPSLSSVPQLGGAKGISLKVIPSDDVQSPKDFRGTNSETILDLTGQDMHADGIMLDPTSGEGWKVHDVVMMEIPHAVLSVANADISTTDYILTDEKTKEEKTISNIAISGTMDISCSSIEIRNDSGTFSEFFESGETVTLDNDCQQHLVEKLAEKDRNPADIAMVYNFLVDSRKSLGTKFSMRLPTAAPLSQTVPCNINQITHPGSVAALP